MSRDEVLELYLKAINKCAAFEMKGKTMPYTSVNGHMFSQVNKQDQLGIRFSKERQLEYLTEWASDYFYSYGAKMKGYVRVPESVLKNTERLANVLQESFEYFSELEAK